jgi:hypothetical protein
MTTAAELTEVFGFHPETPRIRALGTQSAIAHEPDSEATAVAIAVQLLRLSDLTPSGKSLYLQVQPQDALNIAASILSLALRKGWTIDPDLMASIQRVQVPPSNQQH